jgi:hypothetical protein
MPPVLCVHAYTPPGRLLEVLCVFRTAEKLSGLCAVREEGVVYSLQSRLNAFHLSSSVLNVR